jgi:hypothetical protein
VDVTLRCNARARRSIAVRFVIGAFSEEAQRGLMHLGCDAIGCRPDLPITYDGALKRPAGDLGRQISDCVADGAADACCLRDLFRDATEPPAVPRPTPGICFRHNASVGGGATRAGATRPSAQQLAPKPREKTTTRQRVSCNGAMRYQEPLASRLRCVAIRGLA